MFWIGFACGVATFLASAIMLTMVSDRMSRSRRCRDPAEKQVHAQPIKVVLQIAANENRAEKLRLVQSQAENGM